MSDEKRTPEELSLAIDRAKRELATLVAGKSTPKPYDDTLERQLERDFAVLEGQRAKRADESKAKSVAAHSAAYRADGVAYYETGPDDSYVHGAYVKAKTVIAISEQHRPNPGWKPLTSPPKGQVRHISSFAECGSCLPRSAA